MSGETSTGFFASFDLSLVEDGLPTADDGGIIFFLRIANP
jgi:hypothetical protein